MKANNDMANMTVEELTAIVKATQELVRQKRMQERIQSPSYIVRAMPDSKGRDVVKAVVQSCVKHPLPNGLSIWLNRSKHYWTDKGKLSRVSVDVPTYGRVQVYKWEQAPAITDAEAVAAWKMTSNGRKVELYSHAVKIGAYAPILSVDGLIGPGTDGQEVKTL